MTLYKQIELMIVVLSILMFLGTAVINIHDTRSYLATQLESHAQDTATSLGLSLSPHMANNDDALMVSMVDAIFDRGYYENITLRKINGDVIWSRKSGKNIDEVPAWLISWINLEAPDAESIIMSGWQQAGTVYVKSHAGFAYRTLWDTITNMLWWFSGLMLVLLFMANFAVRLLLRPLDRLEKQALAVSEQRFDKITEVPHTRELRNLITAMNYMTDKVKKMFDEQSESTEKFRSLSFQDSLTGLHNRRYFDASLRNCLSDAEEHRGGALLIIQIVDLQGINQRLGFDAADELLKAVAKIITSSAELMDNTVISRLSGGDFAIIIEHVNEEEAGQLGNELCSRLTRLYNEELIDTKNVCQAGVTMYTTGMTCGDVLSRTDNALQASRAQGVNTCSLYSAPEQSGNDMPGRQALQGIVRDAIASRKIILHAQAVSSANNQNNLLHREVLLRLTGPDNELWTAGMFLPIAEQIGLSREIDQIVIGKAFAKLTQSAGNIPLSINISAASLHDADFLTWLELTLKHADIAASLIAFEVSESTVVRDFEGVQRLANLARQHGYGFAVDHFGRGMTSFGYLKSLKPDYVKIGGLYMTDISNNQDDQFFVGSLCKVAHSLDITVIAEAVENNDQLQVLQALGIDGVQGFGIARPAPL